MTATVQPASRDAWPGIRQGAVLLVDKPAGWTSFDVANKVRHLFGVRKVGHAGTLDPAATGLLILCTGAKTREVSGYAGLEKEYDGTLVLGARTPSFDAETPIVETRPVDGVSEERIRAVAGEFVGVIKQIPPMWSAVKVGGRRLYAYARRGQTVDRMPREVSILSFEVRQIAMPEVEFTVVCSKGTYVRALVEDLGMRLGCGAHLLRLRRTRIGPYRVEDAHTIEELVRQHLGRRDEPSS